MCKEISFHSLIVKNPSPNFEIVRRRKHLLSLISPGISKQNKSSDL